jgi:hypothetical protein
MMFSNKLAYQERLMSGGGSGNFLRPAKNGGIRKLQKQLQVGNGLGSKIER